MQCCDSGARYNLNGVDRMNTQELLIFLEKCYDQCVEKEGGWLDPDADVLLVYIQNKLLELENDNA